MSAVLRRWAAGAVAVLLCVGGIGVAYRRHAVQAAFVRADPDSILPRENLRSSALALGHSVYVAQCAACHGAAGKGDQGLGVPDLRDHDWLYGEGRVSEIEAIVRYGIRSRDPRGWNLAAMPAYASPRPYAAEPIPPLSPAETDDVVALLRHYEGQASDRDQVIRGLAVYGKGGCWDCHGADATGDSAIGAPNLRDRITLYGDGSARALRQTVERGRQGISPAFARTLSAAELRAVAVYVASLSQTHPVSETRP